jgi:hypothetical protein
MLISFDMFRHNIVKRRKFALLSQFRVSKVFSAVQRSNSGCSRLEQKPDHLRMLSDGFLDYEETKITMYRTKLHNVNIMILSFQAISSQLPYISTMTLVVYMPHYIH